MEIERKYLVDKHLWNVHKLDNSVQIVQAYLSHSISPTIRIRIMGNDAFLTIKGANKGIVRSEYEYTIPLKDAEEMLEEFCELKISKLRYEFTYKNHLWVVDEFLGKLEGLILAEIELDTIDQQFEKPEFIGKEVSEDPRFYNSELIKLENLQSLNALRSDL